MTQGLMLLWHINLAGKMPWLCMLPSLLKCVRMGDLLMYFPHGTLPLEALSKWRKLLTLGAKSLPDSNYSPPIMLLGYIGLWLQTLSY